MLPDTFDSSEQTPSLDSTPTPAELDLEGLGSESEDLQDSPFQSDDGILPVVGLGGSAGSIEALQEFFSRIPPNLGMAYVVVIHLSPQHDSHLAQVLQTRTSMPVQQVRGDIDILPDHVYVIPPSHHLLMADGQIRLTAPQKGRGQHVAIDLFFRTLATSRRSKAVAVVLSGTDGDGAIGIKRVKEHGGVTIAQDPGDAQHDGMPRSAIQTGMIDWVLSVEQMAPKLVEFIGNERRINLPLPDAPPAQGSSTTQDKVPTSSADEHALREVLGFLQAHTGHDFTHYKRATVLRRIARRLQVNSLANLPDYANFLRTHPGESGALLQDLLISVTNFFRDPEAYWALSTQLAPLFRGKGAGDTVRLWVAGCATGEEAYSLAMLLTEHMDSLDSAPQLQIFATDLDEQALRIAREGVYPTTIVADVSPERIRRFFTSDQGRYRINKGLRERILFASHNLLKDAPFSRLDFVSCRNMLIYFNRTAQEHVMDVFHFALRPGGMLFLGGSESTTDSPLFIAHDKKHRIYERQSVSRTSSSFTPLPLPLSPRLMDVPRVVYSRPALPVPLERREERPTLSFGELHLQMLERVGPPSVLVNASYDIVHLSESASDFLRFARGATSLNLLSVVPAELRIELRAALFRAVQEGESVDVPPISLQISGQERRIGLQLRPLRENIATDEPSEFILVLFVEEESALSPTSGPPTQPSETADRLQEELQHLRSYLRASVEQFEVGAEELKSANEELQALNEEQGSAAEELETSREEIQAAYEELITVNAELKSKVEEISRSHSDLQNLMASTDIATVFLSRDLRIQRYTPRAEELFRFIPSDHGRPLADLRHGFDDETLIGDAERVVKTLVPAEREVRTREGRWFLSRISPYRTVEDKIDGVVLNFVDITSRKLIEESLSQSRENLSAALSLAHISVWRFDSQTGEATLDETLRGLFGFALDLRVSLDTFIGAVHVDDRANFAALIERARLEDSPFEIEHRIVRADTGEVRWIYSRGRTTSRSTPAIFEIVGSSLDVSERRQDEGQLRQSEERLRLLIESAQDHAIYTVTPDNIIDSWNSGAEHIFGYSEEEIIGQNGAILFTPEDRVKNEPAHEIEAALSTGRGEDERWHLRKDGSRFFASGVMRPLVNGGLHGFVKIARDLTERQQAAEALRQSQEQLAHAMEAANMFFWEMHPVTRELSYSPNMESTLGFSFPAQIIGNALNSHIHPDDVEQTIQKTLRALESRGIFEDTFRVINPTTGEITWLYSQGSFIPSPDDSDARFVGLAQNITARKQAEEALHESEEHYRVLVQQNVAGIAETDLAGRITFCNATFCQMLGYECDDLIGKVLLDLVSEADQTESSQFLKQMQQDNLPFETEKRIIRHDGSLLWVHNSVSPLVKGNGEAPGAVIVSIDVSQRKEAEAAQSWLASIVESSNDAIISFALDGTILSWNPGAESMFGWMAPEVVGNPLSVLVPLELEHKQEEMFARFKRGEAIRQLETRRRRKNGEVFDISLTASPIKEGDELVGVTAIIQDISERKRIEKERRTTEERFRAMFEQTTAGIGEYDLQGRHTFANDTLCQMLGYSLEELLQLTLEDITHPDDFPICSELFRQVVESGGTAVAEKRYLRKDGAVVWVNDSTSGIRDTNNETQSVVGVGVDITQRKNAEDELQRAHDELEERVKIRTQELAGALERVGAEVRQRRQAEAGRADLMRRIVTTQEEERGRISRELHDNLGQHLTAVMLGLQSLEMQIETITGGKRNRDTPEHLENLRELVDGLMKAAHRQAWELRPAELDAMGLEAALGQYIRDWSLRLDVPVDFHSIGWQERRPPLEVETTLYRVVQEALTNVARHADASQVSVIIELTNNSASAIVEDDGRGFEPEESEGRLGILGMKERLAIVGGTLDIESAPEAGTTIFARVPLSPPLT